MFMPSSNNNSSFPSITRDRWIGWTLTACALLAGSVLLWITLFLVIESWPLISRRLPAFFSSTGWHPGEGQFGLAPMLAGSLLAALLAVILAAPAGIIVAVWGQYFAPAPLLRIYRGVMELLAGVPSVVYGFWGLIVLVPWVAKWAPPGASLLVGAVVLALMILPLVALSADAALAQVPTRHLRAAASMGVSRWGILRRISLPLALPGIVAGTVLQLGRALGETMAVLMVCGNVVQFPDSLFDPVRTLTANIALEMAYATGDHQTALFVSGLVLLLLTLFLISLARRIGHHVSPAH